LIFPANYCGGKLEAHFVLQPIGLASVIELTLVAWYHRWLSWMKSISRNRDCQQNTFAFISWNAIGW